MKRNQPPGGPCIAQNPAHAAVVASFQKLRQSEIEAFFSRRTRSHSTMMFLREVMFRFMPSKWDRARPHTRFYREGFYWFGRTDDAWYKELALSRKHLEAAFRQCAGFLIVDHFISRGLRTPFYRLAFGKLRDLMEGDQKLQARLQNAAASLPAPDTGYSSGAHAQAGL